MCVLQDGGGQAVSTAEFKHLSREDQEVKKKLISRRQEMKISKRGDLSLPQKKKLKKTLTSENMYCNIYTER